MHACTLAAAPFSVRGECGEDANEASALAGVEVGLVDCCTGTPRCCLHCFLPFLSSHRSAHVDRVKWIDPDGKVTILPPENPDEIFARKVPPYHVFYDPTCDECTSCFVFRMTPLFCHALGLCHHKTFRVENPRSKICGRGS